MANGAVLRLACVFVAAVGISAQAQAPERGVAESSTNADANQTPSPALDTEEAGPSQPDQTASATNRSLIERLLATLSHDDDPDGPINTDRPTFTPANTVVPPGRLQFESGFTFSYQQTAATRSACTTSPNLPCVSG